MGEFVVVKTSDCGVLDLFAPRMTPDETEEQKAAKLHPGHRYRFGMGAASYRFKPYLHFIRQDPNVYSFQEVSR